MKLPRSVSAKELVKSLAKIGYEVTRQKGSHIRVGTLSSIIGNIAMERGSTKEELISQLFG